MNVRFSCQVISACAHVEKSVSVGLLFIVSALGCTKKASQNASENPPAPAATASNTVPRANQPTTRVENNGKIFRYSLSSIVGDNIFCQDFMSLSQAPVIDIETITDTMAVAQAQVPAGALNPLSTKVLGLTVKESSCTQVPKVIQNGHCAVSVTRNVSFGKLTVQTEQRLLWKDLVVLAQATYVNNAIEAKNSALESKNSLFASVQKQITQQQTILNIIQVGQQLTTGSQSQLIEQAQEVLTSLQNQSKQLEADIKSLESEINPIQQELNKQLEKLNTARASLKDSCTPAGMGSDTAEWRNN